MLHVATRLTRCTMTPLHITAEHPGRQSGRTFVEDAILLQPVVPLEPLFSFIIMEASDLQDTEHRKSQCQPEEDSCASEVQQPKFKRLSASDSAVGLEHKRSALGLHW